MKKLVLLLVAMLMVSALSAQQITLFDSEGEAKAYIDYDQDETIYMWDGTPVAFLEEKDQDSCVMSFKGSLLGWYEDGILYDKKGNRVAARKDEMHLITKYEGPKGWQQSVPNRPITVGISIQPVIWQMWWSKTSIADFFNPK